MNLEPRTLFAELVFDGRQEFGRASKPPANKKRFRQKGLGLRVYSRRLRMMSAWCRVEVKV